MLVNNHGLDSDDDSEWDGPADGVVVDAFVSREGIVKLRLINTTDADIDLPDQGDEESTINYEIRVFLDDVLPTQTDVEAR